MTNPNCPKCNGPAIAPTRAGMSAHPYLCTSCDYRFALSLKLSEYLAILNTGHAAATNGTVKGML